MMIAIDVNARCAMSNIIIVIELYEHLEYASCWFASNIEEGTCKFKRALAIPKFTLGFGAIPMEMTAQWYRIWGIHSKKHEHWW